MLCDMHTHSSYSPDADREVTVERMVRRARELGLGHIALTDHCDCNYWYREDETEYPEYQKPDSMMFGARDYAVSSIREAASLAEGYPELICGIELGSAAPGTRSRRRDHENAGAGFRHRLPAHERGQAGLLLDRVR